MILTIPAVFPKIQVRALRARLDSAEWADGRVTAGHQSAQTKNNSQIPENHPVAREVGEMILGRAWPEPALPLCCAAAPGVSPLFNRYAGGQTLWHPR